MRAGYFDYFNGPGPADRPRGPARQGLLQLQPRCLAPGRPELELRPARQGSGRQRMCCRDRRRSTGCEPTSRPTASSARSPTALSRASTPATGATHPRARPSGTRSTQAGADLVLSGDAHDYERFAPQDPGGKLDPARGIRQFVVGTGGVFFTGWSSVKPNSEVRQNNTFGVLFLTLRPGSYEWRFVPEAGRGVHRVRFRHVSRPGARASRRRRRCRRRRPCWGPARSAAPTRTTGSTGRGSGT